MLEEYADRWALVTGASSGIGAEFARLLAARGMHLVLVARRKSRLEELAAELDTRHGTHSLILPADLSEPGAARRLFEEIQTRGIELELLVNNAGFAVVADIENTEPDRVMQMVRLNVAALTELTYLVLPGLLQRGHGAIINVSSVAGLQPVAYMGAYAASKAYVLHFSEALWAECREKGVTVMALCPGVTKTEFFDVAGVSGWLKKQRSQSPEQVARTALKSLEKRRPSVVTGWWNWLRSLVVRLGTRRRVVLESMKYFRPNRRRRRRGAASPEPTDTDASAA
ncbi:MAG: SDR family NAD(P)-dependent oxidoreductase [Planctomycetaceae bacterium]